MVHLPGMVIIYLFFLKHLTSISGYKDLSFNKSAQQKEGPWCQARYCELFHHSNTTLDRRFDTCTRTRPILPSTGSGKTWWYVDLGRMYNVQEVRILFGTTTNIDAQYELVQRGRFAGFSLYLSNSTSIDSGTQCYKDGPELPPLDINVTCAGHARYVFYYNERLPRTPYPVWYELTSITELCEVIVLGCPEGVYGYNCDFPCPANCQARICDIVNGTCYGCKPGWQEGYCNQSCPSGLYGLKCNYQCAGHCLNGSSCNHVTGECPDQCAAGWTGTLCEKKCPLGSYGLDCNNQCAGHCLNDSQCNHVTGECPDKCAAGWTGKYCEKQCPFGSHGSDCKYQCSGHCLNESTCNHVTGECPDKCAAGWTGTYCEKQCSPGSYGLDCNNRCAGHCLNDSQCNHVTGECPDKCAAGWTGIGCEKQCPSGSYGIDCDHQCSGHCLNGAPCSHVTGECPDECAAGWIGTFCEKECPSGSFGLNCKHQCAGHCLNELPCNQVTGECPKKCAAGWTGTFCEKECLPGFYGINCQYPCSGKCVNDVNCSRYDGSCSLGCKDNYVGLACDFLRDSQTSAPTLGLAIVVAVLSLCLIAAFIFFCLRSHHRITQKDGKPKYETEDNVEVVQSSTQPTNYTDEDTHIYQDLDEKDAYELMKASELYAYKNIQYSAYN